MSAGLSANKAAQKLRWQWSEILAAVKRANGEVEPSDGWLVVKERKGSLDVNEFDIGPVVFHVPERGNSTKKVMYVVAEGHLTLGADQCGNDDRIAVCKFGTKVAYFRHKPGFLEHVYGAHYDAAFDELGHPVFHSQMDNLEDLGKHVKELYKIDAVVKTSMRGVLCTVRVPTAQMDFFSLVLQVFADHFLTEGSGNEIKTAFNKLLASSRFLTGSADQSTALSGTIKNTCYRARHWYPVIP